MAAVRVCFYGAGGVGGWLAVRLAASRSAEVQVIARGEHGAAIRDRGLRLRVGSDAGPSVLELPPGAVEVYADVAEAKAQSMRPADFVVLGVKSWQVRESAGEAAELLAPGGCLVTTQNGIQAPKDAAQAVGHERVMAGICKVLAFIAEPGIIEMEQKPAIFNFGEAFHADGSEVKLGSGAPTARAERLAAAFAGCEGVTSGVAAPSAWAAIWEKAVIMCCMGPVGALCRAPQHTIFAQPETRQLLRAAMLEVATCSAAAGHQEATPDEVADRLFALLESGAKPGLTTSTTRDVITGRPSELYQLTGGIRHAGRALGVPTPTHDLIYAALLPQERRARGEDVYLLKGVPGGIPHVAAVL